MASGARVLDVSLGYPHVGLGIWKQQHNSCSLIVHTWFVALCMYHCVCVCVCVCARTYVCAYGEVMIRAPQAKSNKNILML